MVLLISLMLIAKTTSQFAWQPQLGPSPDSSHVLRGASASPRCRPNLFCCGLVSALRCHRCPESRWSVDTTLSGRRDAFSCGSKVQRPTLLSRGLVIKNKSRLAGWREVPLIHCHVLPDRPSFRRRGNEHNCLKEAPSRDSGFLRASSSPVVVHWWSPGFRLG